MYSKGHSVSVNKYSTLLRVKTSLPCSFLLAKIKAVIPKPAGNNPTNILLYCWVMLGSKGIFLKVLQWNCSSNNSGVHSPH